MITKLQNGKWSHPKSTYEFNTHDEAAIDFRFCCEWERCQLID